MFSQLNPATGRRQRWLLAGSVAAHALVLAWMMRSPLPLLLQPSAVALGANGTSFTRLYWTTKSSDNSKFSSSDMATQRYRHERMGHEKLLYKTPAQLAKLAPQNPLSRPDAEDKADAQTLSALGHGAQAGAKYGAVGAPFYGDEVRPALPIATSDPAVYPWQFPTSPGNEVIEITIDDQGNITDKKVLASLGADIDTKCLAALENWRFHPATRNGAPIPSKQDAIFPFKARG